MGFTDAELTFKLILDTPTGVEFETVTTVVADRFVPSTVVTTILAWPVATPVTRPLELTVAIAVLLEDQVTDLLDAVGGVTVAVS